MGKSLGDTLAALARYRRALHPEGGGSDGELTELAPLWPNPGRLRLLALLPPGLKPGAKMVVVLHGCTQTGWGFAHESGWAALAVQHGFALLVPEQRRANNAALCFNWFDPAAMAPGAGEVESVAATVRHMLDRYRLDPARVYLCGLSAGAAFGNVLMATNPDLFAAGVLVAGLPVGVAANTKEAMAAMNGSRTLSGPELAAAMPHIRPTAGRWPCVDIWHGTADPIVVPANARAAVVQCLAHRGLATAAAETTRLGPATCTAWRDPAGQVAVREVLLPDFGHAIPLSLQDPDPRFRVGAAGPYAIDAGLCASAVLAQHWGLLGTPAARAADTAAPHGNGHLHPHGKPALKAVIDKALKAAGLAR